MAILDASIDVKWIETWQAVNAWHGQSLQYFARAELAATETLLALALVPDRGASIRLRHLIGQRLEDLQTALCVQGPFGDIGQKACTALADFRQHEELRQFLCHGVVKLTLEQNGQWVVLLKMLSIRSGKEDRRALTIEQCDGDLLLAHLKKRTRKLEAALQSLCNKLSTITSSQEKAPSTANPASAQPSRSKAAQPAKARAA
jgi:hypothetical protein